MCSHKLLFVLPYVVLVLPPEALVTLPLENPPRLFARQINEGRHVSAHSMQRYLFTGFFERVKNSFQEHFHNILSAA